MATPPKAKRSIYNTFDIDADYIDFNGQPGSGDDIHLTAHTGSKFILESDTQVPEGKKLLVSQVCDKAGVEIFSKDEANGRIKFNIPIDLNNNSLVNNPGGGGGGATTTSGINSENLPGQTLEDELDAITAAGTAQGLAITGNTTAIAANGASITTLSTTQATQAGDITALQTTQGTQGTDITNLQAAQTSQGTDITNLQTTQASQATAIASNTSRTTGLTADRLLVSSSVGTINTGGIGINDVATKNSSNLFTAGLGAPATSNAFDTISASTITNTGTTESVGYTQGGAALNFSHLAGSTTTAQLPSQVVRTDVPDQTLQGNAATSSLTKMTLDNTHATGNTQLVLQKRSTLGVVEGGLTIQQTATGTNITSQAAVGASPNISITPANGTLAMTIGGLETRVHNNFKIIGSMSGAARSDTKEYIFKTTGTGTGDSMLVEDIIQRPNTGAPFSGFNPTADSFLKLSTTGAPSYVAETNFITLPGGANPSANSIIEVDTAGNKSYVESANIIVKPGGANPTFGSFIQVNTGGSLSYIPNTFAPLPGGAFPTSGEKVIMMNPAGSSYLAKEDLILRPTGANPTSGTKLITINNVGTRAYKDLGQFLTTPGSANPSADSFIKISSTGTQSYVAESSLVPVPGGAAPGAQSLVSVDTAGTTTYSAEANFVKKDVANQVINNPTGANAVVIQSDSATNSDNVSLKILRSFAGVENNSIEFIPIPGANTQWRCKNDLDIYINNNHKFRIGNHSIHSYIPLQMEVDFRLKHGQTAPTSSSDTGVQGTMRFDDNYLYVCRATNSWKRVALSTF
jgi:hypothetical protein